MSNLKKMKSRKGRKPSKVIPNRPPQYEASVTFGRKFRFSCSTAATTSSITRAQLLDLIVLNAAANTNYRMIDAIKVNRIRIWGQPPGNAGAGVLAPVAVQWLSENGPTKLISDSGIGSTLGARIDSRPPPMSLASFWSLTGTGEAVTLFVISANAGDIVDLDCSVRFQNQSLTAAGAEAVTTVASTAAGSVGVVYYLSLDLNTTAKFPPVNCKTLV